MGKIVVLVKACGPCPFADVDGDEELVCRMVGFRRIKGAQPPSWCPLHEATVEVRLDEAEREGGE